MLIATPTPQAASLNALFPLLPTEGGELPASDGGFAALLGGILEGEIVTEAVEPDVGEGLPGLEIAPGTAMGIALDIPPPEIAIEIPAARDLAAAPIPEMAAATSAPIIIDPSIIEDDTPAKVAVVSAAVDLLAAQRAHPAAPLEKTHDESMVAMPAPASNNAPAALSAERPPEPTEHNAKPGTAPLPDAPEASPVERPIAEGAAPLTPTTPVRKAAVPASTPTNLPADMPATATSGHAAGTTPASVARPAARPEPSAEPVTATAPANQPAATSTVAMLQTRTAISQAPEARKAAATGITTPAAQAPVNTPVNAPIEAAVEAEAMTAQTVAALPASGREVPREVQSEAALASTAVVQAVAQVSAQPRTEATAPTVAAPVTLEAVETHAGGQSGQQSGDLAGGKPAMPGPQAAMPQAVAAPLPGSFAANLDANLRAGATTGSATGFMTPATPDSTASHWREPLLQTTVRAIESGSPQRIELILNPPALGKVELTLELQSNNHLAAAFRAETVEAQRAIETSLADLRQQLQGNGFSLGEAQVGLSQREQSGQGQQPTPHKAHARQETGAERSGYDATPRDDRPSQNPNRALDVYA